MISWDDIENAIRNWAITGSGFAGTHVQWEGQNAPRPVGPFISLKLMTVRSIGVDWKITRNAAAPVEGAEIEHVVRGSRQATARITCYGPPFGNSGAVAILEKVKTSVKLPSVRSTFTSLGVGIAMIEHIGHFEGVRNLTLVEPRAVMNAQLNLQQDLVETGTYVEYFDATNTLTGETTRHTPEE